MNNIMKNQLGYHFSKTTLKTNFLKNDYEILYSLCFIKIFVRSIKLGFKPIFIEETKIEMKNNHFNFWRLRNE